MEGTQPHQETTSNGTGDGETNSENVVSSETLDTYTNVVDEIVSVNSLFTLGVFIGLSFASRDQTSLECRPGCTAGVGSARRLVVFEVLSFSLFIYSSLVAKCANFLLSLYRDEELRIQYYLILFRKLILDYSGLSSLFSFIFLLLSMVELVQIRLGKLSCGNRFSLGAGISLIVILTAALCIYMYFITISVFFFFFR